MTTYSPQPTLLLNSVALSDDVIINDISVNMGRANILEQPSPGYARVDLWTGGDDPIDVALSQPLQIKIQTPSNGAVSIFNGIVSDIEIKLSGFGNAGSLTIYTLTAVGPLASLNKKVAGFSGFPEEFDGTRILKILTEAFLVEWDDIATNLTWAQLPAETTWESYDGVNNTLVANLTDDIDVPGVYELTAYTGGDANSVTLTTNAAQSGRGVLSEHGDGSLHYDDYLARIDFDQLLLTQDDILSAGLETASQWSEIVNDVFVNYGSGEAIARDETSIFLYGQLTGTRETDLLHLADAQSQAQQFLESRAYPRTYPTTFTIPLHSSTVTNSTRDVLAAVYCGLPITTNDLPAVFGTTFQGYVEGWSWRIREKEAYLQLTTSSLEETYPNIIWYQLPTGMSWADYPADQRWEDI